MIQKALEYLVGLKKAEVVAVDGKNYSTEELHYIEPIFDETPSPAAICISTLTGLVDYIKEKVDNIKKPLIVHIISPTQVSVYSELREDACRDNFIQCKAWIPRIEYERFLDVENFNIMLQSCFLENEHRNAILQIIGNIVEEDVKNTGDNGISQQVTARAGIAKVDNVILPNPVELRPFRTFAEVEQPSSKFIFRMRSGPEAAIFEADGGIWRLYAMQNVKAYLGEKLKDCDIKIIS